jgi:hypothetical protein
MEVALERASRLILRHAKAGEMTFEGLTEAGSAAARELRVRAEPDRQLRKKSARSEDK